MRLDAGRSLARNPGLVGILLLGIALVRILRIALLLRPRTPARDAARRPRRSAKKRLERINELRRRRSGTEHGRDEAGGVERSSHCARSAPEKRADTLI